MPRAQLVLGASLVVILAASGYTPAAEIADPNDNRAPAGSLTNGELTVNLEARAATWQPEGDKGGSLDVATFAEVGKRAQVPGPLIRVRAGTRVRATVRNTFDKPLIVFGLGERGIKDSIVIAPRAQGTASFVASKPGTFFYMGRTELDPLSGGRTAPEQSLNGAIVVDPASGPGRPNDRVMVLSWYSTVNPKSPNGLGKTTMTINGLSWPHTERLDYVQGDSAHWRVINLTDIDHPMHLHGFYFRLEAQGNGVVDSLYPRALQRMAVTEIMHPFRTMTIAWQAERAGNWIFHCHFALHLSSLSSLDMSDGAMKHDMASGHDSDAPHHMFGLVMGMRVASSGPAVQLADAPRPIRITVRQKPNMYADQDGFAFVVDGSAAARDPNAMPVPGEPLILERGRPVAITVVNRTNEHTAIHWHGIELESFPDGVPGWSGSGTSVLPAIMPGDSITVRYTPPRAGSFMYHSHMNEGAQMGGGAYGPIIVVEPGQKFDPAVDRILFLGTAGMPKNVVFGPFTDFVLNGEKQPAPMDLRAGTRYRFRLFNLAGDGPAVMSLRADTTPVMWTFVAKDGYPLPPAQIKRQPARLLFEPGEIYDFEYTPTAGALTLSFGPPLPPPGAPPLPPIFSPPPPTIKVPVRVR
jgi:FtsP/CotA-like multicopper oxidase with cupredoxin domain